MYCPSRSASPSWDSHSVTGSKTCQHPYAKPPARSITPPPPSIPPPEEITYLFVWSEKTGDEPQSCQSDDRIVIRPILSQPGPVGIYPCVASFRWGTIFAEFKCAYDPSTTACFDFIFLEDGRRGGLKKVQNITISLHRELDGRAIRVLDANGNSFMFVQVDFRKWEGDIPIHGDLWGKRALPNETGVYVAGLSGREKADLELERWDEAEKDEHARLLEGREKKLEWADWAWRQEVYYPNGRKVEVDERNVVIFEDSDE